MSIPTNNSAPFGDILDAVGQLPPEDQLALVDIVKRRLAECERKRVVADVQEARREYSEGNCRPVTIDQLKDEIMP